MKTGIDDDAHRPPSPPALDKTSSKKLSISLFGEDTPMTIATHMKGHPTTPLRMAITTDDPAATVLVAPKFPPEIYLQWRSSQQKSLELERIRPRLTLTSNYWR